jgi:phosphoenolpyruvate carboxylase
MPLFETIGDLEAAPADHVGLFRSACDDDTRVVKRGHQEVMIGYSDSATRMAVTSRRPGA